MERPASRRPSGREQRSGRARRILACGLLLAGIAGTWGCKSVLGLKEKSGCNRCVNATTQLVCDGSSVTERACASGQRCSAATGRCDFPVVSLSASANRACAVKADGSIWCWGVDDPLKQRCEGLRPTLVGGGGFATTVSVGALHACATFRVADGGSGGEVRCWGGNAFGELGLGNAPPPSDLCTPTPVPNLPPAVKQITAGFAHTCALTTSGEIYCWGANNVGQCGALPAVSDPAAAPGTPGSPCAGAAGTVAPPPDAGAPDGGAQGSDRVQAQRVPLPGTVAPDQIVSRKNHTCAHAGNRLFCWGANCGGRGDDYTSIQCAYPDGTPAGGQLALDPTKVCFSHTPREIPPVSAAGWGTFALSFASTYAEPLGQAGNVYAWGANGGSQLGIGKTGAEVSSTTTPTLVRTSGTGVLANVQAMISSEGSDLCVALSAGTRRWMCWGGNNCGELGIAPATTSEFAVSAPAIPDDAVPDLVARGDDYGCAVRASDPTSVVCWGALDSAGERDSGVGTCDSRQPETFTVHPVPVAWP